MLARHEDEIEAVRQRPGGGGRVRAADGARRPRRVEAVPVVAFGLQPLDLHVNGVAEFRQRRRLAPPHDAPEAIVRGDLPLHGKGGAGVAGQGE